MAKPWIVNRFNDLLGNTVSATKKVTTANTYARRVSTHHSYDYELAQQNLDISKCLKEGELTDNDQDFNVFLEQTLGNIHKLSKMFMIVNTSIPRMPIIFVSNEFTDFYRYDRNDIFLTDARLQFMVGPQTRPSLFREIKYTLETTTENTLEHTLYTKDGIPIPTTIGLLKVMSASEGKKDEYFAMTFNPFNPKTEETDDLFDKEIMCELGEKSLVSPLVRSKNKVLRPYQKSVLQRCQNYLLENMASMTRLLSDSAVRSAWDWFVLVFTVWAVFSNPIQSLFDGNIYYNPTVDWITDVVFTCDIIVNFRSTFVNQDGLVISSGKKMASHYLSGWFFLDLITSIRWEWVLNTLNWFAKTLFQINEIVVTQTLLGGLKSIRILRMIKVGMNLDNYTRKGPISLALIIVFFLSLGHIFACFWYLLGKYHYENNIEGWIIYYLKDNQYDPTEGILENVEMQPGYYSASLYFIMTTFCTVGFGNISPWNTPEQIFCIFVMLIGAFLYAIVFGSATNIIMQMGAQQSRFLDQQQNLELYTKVNKFPQDLKNRVEDYFYYQWYNSKGIEPSKMMANWPRNLKEDTSLFMHRVLFAEWPVFSQASTGCRRALSSLIKRHGVTPGDYIVHTEDCVESIYFVVKGHLKILKDGAVIGILTKGDTFGDKWWPTEPTGKAVADVMAMTYAELEVLPHESLREILIKFPDFWDIWVKKLDITFELGQHGKIFEALPEDLKMFIKVERMPAHNTDIIGETEFDKNDTGDDLVRETRELLTLLEEKMAAKKKK